MELTLITEIILLNPHGSDETQIKDLYKLFATDFLTHTVQMKQSLLLSLQPISLKLFATDFLTHTVQMKPKKLCSAQ